MKTSNHFQMYDHSGWHWLVPFTLAFAIAVGTALLMLVYPHTAA